MWGLFDKSLLIRLGIAMMVLTALALLGMLSSVVVAEKTQGAAVAVNQAGSLRMQTFRIGMELGRNTADLVPRLNGAINEFERRLDSERLTTVLPSHELSGLHRAYEAVRQEWQTEMRPLVAATIDGTLPAEVAIQLYAERSNHFLDTTNHLVSSIEQNAEANIKWLRLFQGALLIFTLVTIFITMNLITNDVLRPLGELLRCARAARGGDFSVRTQHVGEDELGRLGNAFNTMAEELQRMYSELEARVRTKTRDLERSNQQLELLYQTSKRLNENAFSDRVYSEILARIDEVVGSHGGTICLSTSSDSVPYRLATTRNVPTQMSDICGIDKCQTCFSGDSAHLMEMMREDKSRLRVISTPIRDQERQFGVLMVEVESSQQMETWQIRLLQAVANQIGVALNMARRGIESRRLALLEERSTIARELHDSLAQSLSYLKIQVARLDSMLEPTADNESAREVLGGLREGLNSAYKQLRELLTTFRLKMDGRGLASALDETVRDFSERSGIPIQLENALADIHLSVNEELHVLQVVREAISNVVRHAHASNAVVHLDRRADGDIVVRIEDDGIGIDAQAERKHHYGLAIMQERTNILHGTMTLSPRPGGGTCVELIFTPTGEQSI